MCGLSGIFQYGAAQWSGEEILIETMSRTLAHRGPDGHGIWTSPDSRIGLAHRRLAILDTGATGRQPMASPDGETLIVFNGEIYNFRTLRKELQLKGIGFRTQSDTEVLLHLWEQMGAEMVHRLRGMFAFAIWDNRRQCLFAARDPMGIKPFYYHDDGARLIFASQVTAVRAALPSTSACPAGTVGFYLMGSVPEPFTLYREIRSLPAGHTLLCRRGQAPVLRTYWSMVERVSALCAAPPEPLPLATLMKDSVAHHLVSDVPVGIFLSAGIDSGVLAGLSHEQGQDLTAFTLGFDEYVGTELDETVLAATVANAYGLPHVVSRLGKDEYRAEIPRILEAMDQPSIDGVNTYFVAKAAKEHGIKVALSGLGADELFGGYAHFASIPKWLPVTRLAATCPGLGKAARVLGRRILPSCIPSKAAGFLEYGGSLADSYLLRRCLMPPWELALHMDGDFLAAGWEELAMRQSLRAMEGASPRPRVALGVLESCVYMRNQLLRDADWAGMAHGVEIRVPFVDVPLFEGVIARLAAGQSATKNDLFATVSSGLPERVRRRRKTGFNVPFNRWRNQSPKDYAAWLMTSFAAAPAL